MTPYTRLAINIAANIFQVPTSFIMGDCRARPVARARWAAIVMLKDRALSTSHIARELGIDHTSVLHAMKNTRLIDQDKLTSARKLFSENIGRVDWFCDLAVGPPPPKPKLRAKEKPKLPDPDDVWAGLLGGHRTISFARAGLKMAAE
jgi:hypothetical protein